MSTSYDLTITKRTPNPDYVAPPSNQISPYGDTSREFREWQEKHGYKPEFLELRTLSVTVTEETFAAIRKAAVETL